MLNRKNINDENATLTSTFHCNYQVYVQLQLSANKTTYVSIHKVKMLNTSYMNTAYRLHAHSVYDMNSVLEMVSGQYATQFSLTYLLT